MATPEIQQLSQELGQLTRALQGLVNSSSRTAAAQQANIELHLDINDQLSDYRKSLTKGQVLTKKQQALADEAVKLKRQEIEAGRRLAKAQAEAEMIARRSNATEAEKARKAQAASRANVAYQEAQDKATSAAGVLTDSMGGLVKGTNLANASLVWFGATLRTQGQQLLKQNAANGGLIEGTRTLIEAMGSQQNLALKFGLAGAELAGISAASRQVINAMGGSKTAFAEMSPTITRFRIMTGDFVEGAKLAAEAATELAKKGISPTTTSLERYANDIVLLGKRTGMGAREAAAYFSEVASDSESIDILRSARADEREAILASQRAFLNNAVAAGMSAEQAKEAAKMLNKMVAAKPLDRLKQAAKVRALGGAMGIAGADEAAQGIIAGKRATEAQREAIKTFSTAAANLADQSAMQGIGTEIFTTALLEKLDLEQYLGKGSPMSTSLADTMKPTLDVQKQYIEVAQTAAGQAADDAAKLYKQAVLIASGNHWGGTAVAAVVAAATTLAALATGGLAALLTGAVTGGLTKIIGGRLGGKLGGLLSGTRQTTPTATPTGGRVNPNAPTATPTGGRVNPNTPTAAAPTTPTATPVNARTPANAVPTATPTGGRTTFPNAGTASNPTAPTPPTASRVVGTATPTPTLSTANAKALAGLNKATDAMAASASSTTNIAMDTSRAAGAATKAADTAAAVASIKPPVAPMPAVPPTAAVDAAKTTATTAEAVAKATSSPIAKIGDILGKLGPSLKLIAGVGTVVEVGSGVADLAQGKKQESVDGWDMASPMRWGMKAGDTFNKTFEAMFDKSVGSTVYDLMNKDANKQAPPAPIKPSKPAEENAEAAKKTAESSAAIKAATIQTAEGVSNQLKKVDSTNEYLKQLTSLTERQVELFEKQLVASTMTERERANPTTRIDLRRDNRFATRYNYV